MEKVVSTMQLVLRRTLDCAQGTSLLLFSEYCKRMQEKMGCGVKREVPQNPGFGWIHSLLFEGDS